MRIIFVMLVLAVLLAPASVGAGDSFRAYFSVTDAFGIVVQEAEVKVVGQKDKSCITDKHGYCSIYFATAEEMKTLSAFAKKGARESTLALISNGMTTMLTIE